MSLQFIPPDVDTMSKNLRFYTDTYNVVVQYAKENDIKDFNTALNIMLRRISRIGVRRFYDATQHTQTMNMTSHGQKSPVVGTIHGDLYISDPERE
jgi:hypothetical protein